MARIWGRAKDFLGHSIELPINSFRVHGAPIDITNFDGFILGIAPKNLPISSLSDSKIDNLSQKDILALQAQLLKIQLHFSYYTTPAIKYLWDQFGLSPKEIINWNTFRSKVLPITKTHQRMLGWMNFLPAPIAEYFMNGAPECSNINPNFYIDKRKWTGGTSAIKGNDYVYVIIPRADWRASVQTMIQISKPVNELIRELGLAATTYDRRHIAEPIFEDLLRGYGVHLLAKPAGASDDAFFDMIRENQIQILVAPPLDHPAKGQGIPGALKEIADQLKLVLMSSATPTEDTLKMLADHQIAVLNVGGDTGSLPTYYSLVVPNGNKNIVMDDMKSLDIIQIAPSFTEIINPRNLLPAKLDSWGVLLQTNYAAVWENGKYLMQNGTQVWVPDGTSQLIPALKTQMIRSSATGNLVYVTRTNNNNTPIRFNHIILRYNDFDLDTNLKPVLDFPRSSGGSATGGCAA